MILFICLISLCHQTNTMKRAICWRLSPETIYISDARYLSQVEVTESMHPYFSLYYSSCLPFTTCFHVFNKEKRFWKFTTGVRSSRCEIKGPTTYLIFSLYHVSMDELSQLWFHVLKEVTSLFLVCSYVLKGEKEKGLFAVYDGLFTIYFSLHSPHYVPCLEKRKKKRNEKGC